MPNKYAGEISVRLDRVRTLKFDLNALAEFEGLEGKSLFDIFRGTGSDDEVRRSIGLKQIRSMLTVALQHEDPDMTPRRAAQLVEQADGESLSDKLNYVTERLLEAFVLMGGAAAKKKLEELQETGELPMSISSTSSASPTASSASSPGNSGGSR